MPIGPRVLIVVLAALLALSPGRAVAQAVTSPGPDHVSVTIYRDPSRGPDAEMNLHWLEGYALVTETRRITIPAGDATIRFEGVAGGIYPESAIVTGLPDGVTEKNLDADLLSPGALLGRATGRRVTVRRTNPATGEVTEQEAFLRSGPAGAAVLQTKEGFEALRCSGLPETLIYDSVPAGLSARPTLSVRTHSDRAASATVTLSYLAAGFDWQANYVANLSPDGKRLDLFAWLTLASGDPTSFVDADAQAVAGKPNREDEARPDTPEPRPLTLHCWPQGTTTSGLDRLIPPPPPPPPPAPREDLLNGLPQAIVVTGSRIPRMNAKQEELGDLKLYRIPEPVTVAAISQKQVAFLDKSDVPVEIVYRSDIYEDEASEPRMTLYMVNRADRGLGVPLPAGGLVLFNASRSRPLLLGEGTTDDKAVGEDIEIDVADATNVTAETELTGEGRRWRNYRVTARNANARPVLFEAKIAIDDGDRLTRPSRKLTSKDGARIWRVTIPANGSASLSYRVERSD